MADVDVSINQLAYLKNLLTIVMALVVKVKVVCPSVNGLKLLGLRLEGDHRDVHVWLKHKYRLLI